MTIDREAIATDDKTAREILAKHVREDGWPLDAEDIQQGIDIGIFSDKALAAMEEYANLRVAQSTRTDATARDAGMVIKNVTIITDGNSVLTVPIDEMHNFSGNVVRRALKSPQEGADIAEGDSKISVEVAMRQTSAGADYFVEISCGERSVTPHVFKERWKAEYEAAHYSWVFGLRVDEPDLLAFSAESHPNLATDPSPSAAVPEGEIDCDDPRFNLGVSLTVNLLAKALQVSNWVGGDGSESYDEDLSQTLLNILIAKGLYDVETGTWATLAPAVPEGWKLVPIEPTENGAALREALQKVRQELWVDYCLQRGSTQTDPKSFQSKPHIRIIDDALSASPAPIQSGG